MIRHLQQANAKKIVDRLVRMRLGVGAAADVIQEAELTSHRVQTDSPMLVVVDSGSKTLRWMDGECTATAGDAVALAAGQTLDITNRLGDTGQYRARWLAWDTATIETFAAQTRRSTAILRTSSVLPKISQPFKHTFDLAFEAVCDDDLIPPSIAVHRSLEVLLWLQLGHIIFSTPELTTMWSRIRKLFVADPARQWTVDDIANRLNVSPATLRRRLAAENITYRELLQDVRMSHALTLLQSTDDSVLEVALGVGYDSASRFAVRFKSRFGYSPSDIRGHRRGARHLCSAGSRALQRAFGG